MTLRIVSLVPSLTESICDLGRENALVGCTSFCSHPARLRKTLPSVGGTKDADIQKIIALAPTHIITNKEENTSHLIHDLKKHLSSAQTIETFPQNIEETKACLKEICELVSGDSSFFSSWQLEVNQLHSELKNETIKNSKIMTYRYFIWKNPWMVAGSESYIASMLEEAGFKNSVQTTQKLEERYPSITAQSVTECPSDFYFFSSEPFPFRNRHIETFCQEAKVSVNRCYKVDGQALSWFGTRLTHGLREILRIKKITFSDSGLNL